MLFFRECQFAAVSKFMTEEFCYFGLLNDTDIEFQIRPVYHNINKVQKYDGRGLSKCNLLCRNWSAKIH